MKIIYKNVKALLLGVLLVACSAEEPAGLDTDLDNNGDQTADVQTSDGTMTAKVDGTDFTGLEYVTARVVNGSDGDIIVITGKKGTEVITLKMPIDIAVNNVNSPYTLGNASTMYQATYNTNNTSIFSAAPNGGFHATFDESLWVADVPSAIISGGNTTVKGEKGNNGQRFEFVINGTEANSYQFGPIAEGSTTYNTGKYQENNVGGKRYTTLSDAMNGNFIITKIDTDNKLISGTFNFDGRHYFTYNPSNQPTGTDTDGDGVIDSVEQENGTDPNDPCSPIKPEGYMGYNSANAIWLAGDCDNDGTTNQEELEGPDGDINTPTDATDPYEGNTDTDGDGISDEQEVLDNTDSTDPCDPAQEAGYMGYDADNTSWQNGDCDGDGVSNNDELTDGDDTTYPYFVETEDKSFTSGSFNNITYTGGGMVRWGLNIISHDPNTNKLVGSFRFITASIGQDPVESQVITDGLFDVVYVE